MVELFAEAEEGKLDWNQKLELTDQDKVSGSGVLTELSAGDTLTHPGPDAPDDRGQ